MRAKPVSYLTGFFYSYLASLFFSIAPPPLLVPKTWCISSANLHRLVKKMLRHCISYIICVSLALGDESNDLCSIIIALTQIDY